MACKNICKLCDRLVISQSVTFNPVANRLVIGLPDGTYLNKEKYCIVIAQTIPTNVTISADVAFIIGDETTQYPLYDSCCSPVLAKALRTRTKYSTVVKTNTAGGIFKLLGKLCHCLNNNDDRETLN